MSGTQSVSEAFKEMGRSILQTMAQIAQQEATRAFIRLGLSLLTGAATGPTAASTGAGGGGAGGTFLGSVLGGGGPQPGGGVPFSFAQMLGSTGGGGGGGAGFQHGGIINRRTLALVGENPAHNPEVILNRQQMQGLMSSVFRGGPSAGGQAAGGGIAIFNFPSRQAAEQEMAQQRALGREIVMNEVLTDLGRGESSQINRMIRTLAR